MTDKTKRRIRIVINNNTMANATTVAEADANYNNVDSSCSTSKTQNVSDIKRTNIDYNGDYAWTNGFLDLSGRSKNDKNWENWERIREQKLEKMKNICFESYRQSKRDKMQMTKPKPRQLDSTWYTDNIYSNRSEDLEEDYVPDCLKYHTYRKLRNIHEQEELFGAEEETRGEGEGAVCYGLQRSTSCKEFQYPKSQSWCFEGNVYEAGGSGVVNGATAPTSILKNRSNVPKSYSFSASTTKTTPFDVMDYDLPHADSMRRQRQEVYRRNAAAFYSSSLDENSTALTHSCCPREHCTNVKCLLDDIYPCYTQRRGWRRSPSGLDMYSADASGGSNRNLHAAATTAAARAGAAAAETSDWLLDGHDDHRVATASSYALHSLRESGQQDASLPPSMICCCATDDYCYHCQQQHHMARSRTRLLCPGHHPAAEEEEHMHCRYDTHLDHFIRDERERLLLQDKFLDDDERYLTAATATVPSSRYATSYRRPARSKSLLEVQPPSHYDEDTCSESTEMDLEDFNIDLEKYWEELEKPPSPIDLDMQRRNMRSNLKVKNVNVRCYNNGQPIDMHDREHERLMIKKSLLEGMPSPPQPEPGSSTIAGNNVNNFHYFEQAGSPLHRAFNYGHKVYPVSNPLPTYKYNNFYPEHDADSSGVCGVNDCTGVQTQQPIAGVRHTSASGNSALSLINNIFSIYKPNKYSPQNCQMNFENKPEPCKKMNMPSTRRPLGTLHSDYVHSMKRPLTIRTEHPQFKIIPEKTGLKITPLYTYDDYGDKQQARHKLTSTARPLMLPH